MLNRSILLLLLTASAFNSLAQGTYFSNLTTVLIDENYKVYFHYDKSCTRLINRACETLPKNDPFYCPETMLEEGGVVVAKMKVPSRKDSVDILYSAGMSADPGFDIWTKARKRIGSFSALDLYINSSGTIYISGHTNKMFDRREKFQFTTDSIAEVTQPFYYVGLKGKTLKSISLYEGKAGADVMAQLPKGYMVEVLLAEPAIKDFGSESYYLVRTDFGLVGWLRLGETDSMDPVIEGLYYAGD